MKVGLAGGGVGARVLRVPHPHLSCSANFRLLLDYLRESAGVPWDTGRLSWKEAGSAGVWQERGEEAICTDRPRLALPLSGHGPRVWAGQGLPSLWRGRTPALSIRGSQGTLSFCRR